METAVSAEPGSFVRGEPVGVDVGGIERELAALWRASSHGSDGAPAAAVVRACLWNLVVRASEPSRERVREMVLRAVPSCPARVVSLNVALDGPPGGRLVAEVSAHCEMAPGGGALLCSEEIAIEAAGDARAHVPGLVRALRVSDVPTALVWMAPLASDELTALCADAERLVVDTGDLDGGRELAALDPLCAVAARVAVADLGWLRLGPFRLLLAGVFDAPLGSAPLARLSEVRMLCAHHGVATAGLLCGWLASRLGWATIRASGAGRWRAARKDGGEVELVIEHEDIEAGRDGIHTLVLSSEDGVCARISDHGREALQVEATGLPTRILASGERPDHELLVAALGARGHDPLFALALGRAAELSR